MTKNLTDIEIKLLANIQNGFGVSLTPYKDIAESISIDVREVIAILNKWKTDGLIRRVGAIVNHFKVGLNSAAMVVWKVPPKAIERTGRLFASFEQVSHAYQRPAKANWPYNFYTMVHGFDRQSVIETVRQMSEQAEIGDYKLLETITELKKVRPVYIYQGLSNKEDLDSTEK